MWLILCKVSTISWNKKIFCHLVIHFFKKILYVSAIVHQQSNLRKIKSARIGFKSLLALFTAS